MINKIIKELESNLNEQLSPSQILVVAETLNSILSNYYISENNEHHGASDNDLLIDEFLSAKSIEGCSKKTLAYYKKSIKDTISSIGKAIVSIKTNDLRKYLSEYQSSRGLSKVTIDNIRRILSSFFSWLEDEDHIIKSPTRRIHKVKFGRTVKDTFSDEEIEALRDHCDEIRDLAMVEILFSTGMRVGELVNLNIKDINFNERECVVYGKGDSERLVYFDARTKIHLSQYINSRKDSNKALFVSLDKNHVRLGINGIETRLKKIGMLSGIESIHPHKFRRTMATNAINKGMPIEQVQKLLGHVRIDTTLHYAMVNQNNVKISHRKYIS